MILRPGDGPAAKVSVSTRAGNIRAVKERAGARARSNMSAGTVEFEVTSGGRVRYAIDDATRIVW